MLLKLSPVVRTIAQASRTSAASVRSCSHGHHKSLAEVVKEHRMTMNDIPVPSGSWQENYSKRNAKWNMMLGASVASLIATIFVMDQSGCFYFHSSPELKDVNINVK